MSDTLTEAGYRNKIELELHETANQLFPFFSLLEPITTYSQLLSLDAEILSILVRFEKAHVDLNELLNPGIDFHSSGHHTDKLDIYRDALKRVPSAKGIYIYMNDDGSFQFNVLDDVNAYL